MPRKSTKAAEPDLQQITDQLVAALRDMDELSAEPLNDGSGLIAVVGFIDVVKVVATLVEAKG